MKMRLFHVSVATAFAATLIFKVSTQCIDGQVRLVGGSGSHEGRVEVFIDHEWGAVTVCDDNSQYGNEDIARVVCGQLGYTPERAQALTDENFGQGSGMIALENVECNPSKHCTLLQCPLRQEGSCDMVNVGVKCDEKIVKSVSAANVTTTNYSTLHTVLINVTLVNNTSNSFQVGCYNQRHGIYVTKSVSDKTSSFTAHLRGLFPSSLYTCCISKVYEPCQQYLARGTCISIKTTESSDLFTGRLSSTSKPVDSRISNQAQSKAMVSVRIVGGILGFIIAVLLTLLITLVCLLISKRRRSTIVDLCTNSSILPIDQNLRYAMIPSSQATSGTYAQVGRSTRQENESAPNYSRLGPAHVIDDQGRQQGSQNRISSNVRERYEFAEIHNMETNRQDFGHADYSHLRH